MLKKRLALLGMSVLLMAGCRDDGKPTPASDTEQVRRNLQLDFDALGEMCPLP